MNGMQIAVVDDDLLFLEHISTVLKHEGDLRTVKSTNGRELFEAIDNQHLSCIVLDYDLGGETGLALGQSIKQKYADPPPIVMLTGAGSERTATKAFRIGFSDYVSKRNLDAKELVSAIRGAISRHEEQRALHQEVERLRGQQRFDSLTGLHTNSYLRARLDELALGRNAPGFTLIAITIAMMDPLRDHLGNAAVGQLLKEFAARLGVLKLPDAFLGHLGTREFACVFEGQVDADALDHHCGRIRNEASLAFQHGALRIDAVPHVGTASFPDDGVSVETVIAAAREALARDTNAVGGVSEAGSAGTAAAGAQPAPVPGVGVFEKSDLSPQPERRRSAEPDGVDEEQRKTQRRVEQRYRVLKKGKILVDGLNTVIDCTIRNVSASGAQIRVSGFFIPPERFKLILADSDEARWVTVRWQVAGDIGVQFT